MPLFVICLGAMKGSKTTPAVGWVTAPAIDVAKEIAGHDCVERFPPTDGWTDHYHGAQEIPMAEIFAEYKAIKERMGSSDKPVPMCFQPVPTVP